MGGLLQGEACFIEIIVLSIVAMRKCYKCLHQCVFHFDKDGHKLVFSVTQDTYFII
jgi:hypothetical protein